MRPPLLITAALALILAACGEEVSYQDDATPDSGDNNSNNTNNTNNIEPECAAPFECEGLPHDDCVGSFSCLEGRCVYECADAECVEIEESLRAAREAALACDPAVGCALVTNAGVCSCGGTALSRGADLARIEALAADFTACFGVRCIPCELPIGAACVDGACQEVFSFECAPEGRFGSALASWKTSPFVSFS